MRNRIENYKLINKYTKECIAWKKINDKESTPIIDRVPRWWRFTCEKIDNPYFQGMCMFYIIKKIKYKKIFLDTNQKTNPKTVPLLIPSCYRLLFLMSPEQGRGKQKFIYWIVSLLHAQDICSSTGATKHKVNSLKWNHKMLKYSLGFLS